MHQPYTQYGHSRQVNQQQKYVAVDKYWYLRNIYLDGGARVYADVLSHSVPTNLIISRRIMRCNI
jgi:hypothetical protein